MIAHTENTTNVKRFVSCFVGQVTFFISRPTSAKKPFMPRRDFGVGMLVGPFGVVGVLDINVRFRLKPWGDEKIYHFEACQSYPLRLPFYCINL